MNLEAINKWLDEKLTELYKKYCDLEQENKQLQKDIKNIIKILEKNCDNLEVTEEEFDSLDRWQGLQTVELEQGSDSNERMITDNEKFIEIQGILTLSDISSKDCIKINNLIIELSKENQELKKQLEETNKMIEKCGFVNIEQVMLSYCGLIAQQKEFINYLEDEKDRLARECSNIYEDSLGKTRLVNEDIFDEINDVLQKYKEIIGGK